MSSTEKEFFEGKRTWSKLKDKVLGQYLVPYLRKINCKKKEIILVDSFAGPGEYDTDNEVGSPVFFCRIAEENVRGKYKIYLVNKNKIHHEKLLETLKEYLIDDKVIPIYGDADTLLNELIKEIRDQVVLAYLDPFGLKGTDFNTISKYLIRDKQYSTELLINLSIPTLFRLSSINKIQKNGISEIIKKKHDVITKALGGDYWKSVLLDYTISTREEEKLIQAYKEQLSKFLPFISHCKVYEKGEKSTLKYVIFLASRHPDAQCLMNDIMLTAYYDHIYKSTSGDLFKDLPWDRSINDYDQRMLLRDILTVVAKSKKISRINAWKKIAYHRFMKYLSSHYLKAVRELVKDGVIDFIDVRKTGKLNDESILFYKENIRWQQIQQLNGQNPPGIRLLVVQKSVPAVNFVMLIAWLNV